MNDPSRYKQTPPMKGVWLLFVSKQRYLNAAIEHSAWLNLQAQDLRQKFLEGSFSLDSEASRAIELPRFESLRRQFWHSFGQTTLVAILTLLIGVYIKSIALELPVHPGKVIGFCGTYLVAWAALFELGGPRLSSWDGETLSEIVHPRIFQILFISGTFALMCSILL
jgi:hypothetical protein